jgi:hypothetical protein
MRDAANLIPVFSEDFKEYVGWGKGSSSHRDLEHRTCILEYNATIGIVVHHSDHRQSAICVGSIRRISPPSLCGLRGRIGCARLSEVVVSELTYPLMMTQSYFVSGRHIRVLPAV